MCLSMNIFMETESKNRSMILELFSAADRCYLVPYSLTHSIKAPQNTCRAPHLSAAHPRKLLTENKRSKNLLHNSRTEFYL